MSYLILVPWVRQAALTSITVVLGCASSSSSGERTSTTSAAARFEAMAQRPNIAPACVG